MTQAANATAAVRCVLLVWHRQGNEPVILNPPDTGPGQYPVVFVTWRAGLTGIPKHNALRQFHQQVLGIDLTAWLHVDRFDHGVAFGV